MYRILVCEDEAAIRSFIVVSLKRIGYDVVDVASGEEALQTFNEQKSLGRGFDVVLLDIMLPGISGLDVCEKLRHENEGLGIIMLSAKSQEIDKVMGLQLGADDYITKPFAPSELNARVDAMCRRVSLTRGNHQVETTIRSGPFELDTKSRTLKRNNELIELTQIEYKILEYLMSRKNEAVERKEILDAVWGKNYFGGEKIIDVNIRRLRIKVEPDPNNPQYITTVWSFGYKWNEQ